MDGGRVEGEEGREREGVAQSDRGCCYIRGMDDSGVQICHIGDGMIDDADMTLSNKCLQYFMHPNIIHGGPLQKLKDMAEGVLDRCKAENKSRSNPSEGSNIVNHSSSENHTGGTAAFQLPDSNIQAGNASGNGNKTLGDEAEWVEQAEPGVYITVSALPGGEKYLKRVRFSRKRFSEQQAEQWWADNRSKLQEKYIILTQDKSNCPS
ncbi:hypothetical protein Taro_034352 [Colocasia esculenta]|uniref:BRX domain-containing protein n=1 Tax=Colocasia esculenta TaxID=4460 RepID=A0A843WBP6_COLES|nr:hypothetical protein [Colocasia esculenta]